eukprot:1795904-Ditylum_brightwellii.AAC.1
MMSPGPNWQRHQGRNISCLSEKEERGKDVGPRSEGRGKEDLDRIGMEMMRMMIGNIKKEKGQRE